MPGGEEWTENPGRMEEAGVSEDAGLATEPEIALRMLLRGLWTPR